MTPATLALLAQFAIEFGMPLAKQLAEMFRTPNPTWEQWDAVCALAETPFDKGLKPVPTTTVGPWTGTPTPP